MRKFTFDTNCLIDLDEDRPNAEYIRSLIKAHENKDASIALVASSASERQQSKETNFLENFAVFDRRRKELGLGDAALLPSIGRFDISFFDNALMGCDASIAREEVIYRVLAGGSEFEWEDYAANDGVEKNDRTSPSYFRWRNKLLDAQAFWAHEHANRDVFVTSDGRFKNLNGHDEFPAAIVLTPREAAELL